MPAIAAAMIGTSPHLIFTYSELANVRNGSFTTDAFSTRADQRPLLLQEMG
jgi:hypothetical protein